MLSSRLSSDRSVDRTTALTILGGLVRSSFCLSLLLGLLSSAGEV
jgi:hypothetical protein